MREVAEGEEAEVVGEVRTMNSTASPPREWEARDARAQASLCWRNMSQSEKRAMHHTMRWARKGHGWNKKKRRRRNGRW